MTKTNHILVAGVLLASVALAPAACGVDDLNLDNRACPCGAGYVCEATRNTCVRPESLSLLDAATAEPCRGPQCACTTNANCRDPAYPQCFSGSCVACTTAPDSCGVGSYCLPSNECAPGCKKDAECAQLSPSAPICNTQRHQCVDCASSQDCKDGKQCSPAGACVTTCKVAGTKCPDGATTCCNGLCIDTTSDVLNCNGCGLTCGGGDTLCCASKCSNPLTSPDNCGRCGAACNSTANVTGASCAAGACTFSCAPGFAHCALGNTGCERSVSTVSECGGCGIDCNAQVKNATGISCKANACSFTACKPGLYDVDGIPSNGCEPCGARDQYCCPGNLCTGGARCEPKPGNDGKCH